MTSDEIKSSISMFDLVRSYGIKVNRAGMCSCPFHGRDIHPSMKIYKDGFKCFACGECGDLFSFVMKMDGCDFKTAYEKLGGTYKQKQKMTFAEKQKMERNIQKNRRRVIADLRHEKKKDELHKALTYYRSKIGELEPFSDDWCMVQRDVPLILGYIEQEISGNGNEVEINGAIGRYREFRRKRNNG